MNLTVLIQRSFHNRVELIYATSQNGLDGGGGTQLSATEPIW
jgi:hypothetical protein